MQQEFVRDRVTVLAYGVLASFSVLLYGMGPVLTFLHDELGLSYTVTSLHSTLFAAGGAIAGGLLFHQLTRWQGRYRVVWTAAAATAAGAVLLLAGHTVAITLAAATLLGTVGTVVQTASQAVLADHHGPTRARALIESNIGASAAAVLAPLLLGLLHGTPLGWRAALLLPVAGFVALFVLGARQPLPEPVSPPPDSQHHFRRLPARYWVLAVLVALTVGLEFCIVFYGAELLTVKGFSSATAATVLSVFYAAMLAGRLAGSGLARQPGRTLGLTALALGVTTAGFLTFWLSEQLPVVLGGLVITGLGIANLYPLTLALAVAAAPGNTDKATAWTHLLAGPAMMLAPLVLGTLADHIGVLAAFTIEPVLLAAALVLLGAAAYHPRTQQPTHP